MIRPNSRFTHHVSRITFRHHTDNKECKEVSETCPLQSEKKIFALYRNYPNPFNPEMWIPFQLASEADIVIRIYDIKGQLVRTLDLGSQPAGTYITKDKAVSWNGKNNEGDLVSSGVYFYTLEVNGKKIGTRRMIMLK